MREIFGRLASNLSRRRRDGETTSTVVCYCDHGKHRSVAVASMLAEALRRASPDWNVVGPRHQHRYYWSAKKCGAAGSQWCRLFDATYDHKEQHFEEAAKMWLDVWSEQVEQDVGARGYQ